MNKHLYAIFALAFIILLLPFHLRFLHDNPTLPGTAPYYHTLTATNIADGTTPNQPITSRPYLFNPYHYVLASLYLLFGTIAFTLTPLLFALLSILFLNLALTQFNISASTRLWILLAYTLSPPVITAGTLAVPHAFALCLLTASVWLLYTKWWPAGTITITLTALTGLPHALAALALLLFLSFIKRNNALLTSIAPVALILLLGIHPYTVPLAPGLAQYISDFGGTFGFSVFALLLATVGIAALWKYKKAYYGSFAMLAFLLFISYHLPHLLTYTNIIISALAGNALSLLADRKWHLHYLRPVTLLVLFCGLLFSGLAHAVATADSPPTPRFFDSLSFPPSTILSHNQYGFWIASAGHTPVTDPLWKQRPRPQELHGDTATLFHSTDPEITLALLNKYNATHILITPEMEQGLVWERPEQGLNFLVENSEMFKRLETGTSIRIWEVT